LDDAVTAMGTAVQRCNIGNAVVSAFATSFTQGENISAATMTCLAGRLGTDARARRFLVFSMLDRRADLAAAHGLIGLIAACLDIPALVLSAAHMQVDAATRTCLLESLKSSDAQLKDYLAYKIAGLDTTSQEVALEVSVNHCRPGAHTGFTLPSG
jgi:hypothetical protein